MKNEDAIKNPDKGVSNPEVPKSMKTHEKHNNKSVSVRIV